MFTSGHTRIVAASVRVAARGNPRPLRGIQGAVTMLAAIQSVSLSSAVALVLDVAEIVPKSPVPLVGFRLAPDAFFAIQHFAVGFARLVDVAERRLHRPPCVPFPGATFQARNLLVLCVVRCAVFIDEAKAVFYCPRVSVPLYVAF